MMSETLKLLFILLVTCTTFSCIKKNYIDCDHFKNGKFVFKVKGEYQGLTFLIERKDSIQIERGSNGWVTKLYVNWIDSCTYETKLLETTSIFPDSIQEIRKNIPFRVHILECTEKYYTFSGQRGNWTALIDTMWVRE